MVAKATALAHPDLNGPIVCGLRIKGRSAANREGWRDSLLVGGHFNNIAIINDKIIIMSLGKIPETAVGIINHLRDILRRHFQNHTDRET